MSRIASVAVAGYYPTPPHLLRRIADQIGVLIPGGRYAFMDPCAGEGEALGEIVDRLCPRPAILTTSLNETDRGPTVVAVELEQFRSYALQARIGRSWYGPNQIHWGDAFRLHWTRTPKRNGVSCLYLNPPYDFHPRLKRLEEKFLQRFTDALAPGGVLVFVVPFYALKASAATLARHYQNVSCFRFPDPDWDAYKQVVLYANRRQTALLDPDPVLQEQIESWAVDATPLPVLPDGSLLKSVALPLPPGNPLGNRYQDEMPGLDSVELLPMDLGTVLASYRPWGITDRRVSTALIPGPFVDPFSDDLTTREYPTLMPPRPAHIAAGIASGVFNGERVVPDDPTSGAPDLLVKGVFDREFETVGEKHDSNGRVTGEIQVQQPRLVVTVLNLQTSGVHVLKSSVETTGTLDPAQMTTGDLLTLYSRSLLATLRAHCPVVYDPSVPSQAFPLPALARRLYTAQAHAVRALVMDLGGPDVPVTDREGLNTVLLGEIGSGKSTVAMATARACGANRVLVMCPPHLLDSWRDEVRAVIPDAEVMVLADIGVVQEFAASKNPGLIVGLLSRETAKLGHAYAGIGAVCPRCGTPQTSTPEEQVKGRLRCKHTSRRPGNEGAVMAEDLALRVLPFFPRNPVVSRLAQQKMGLRLHERIVKSYVDARTSNGHDVPLTSADVAKLRADPWIRGLWREVVRLMTETYNSWLGDDNRHWLAMRSLVMFYADDDLLLEIVQTLMLGSSFEAELYRPCSAYLTMALRLVPYMTPDCPQQEEALQWLSACVGPGRLGTDDVYSARVRIRKLRGSESPLTETPNQLTSKNGVLYYNGLVRGDAHHLAQAVERVYALGSWRAPSEPCGEVLFQAIPEPRRYPLATYIARHQPDCFDFLILDEAHELGTDGSAQERAAHRLSGVGKPTVLMTGTIMNGYARSLFANWWAMFPRFRKEFARDDQKRFVDRFGYRQRLLTDHDKDTKEILEFGSRTDRINRKEKDLGDAPGLLPLFILDYLLPHAATIQKADLELELPPCRDIPVRVKPTTEQFGRHTAMLDALIAQIQADAFTPLMGKLWGQMAESPSQLDRATADVGNAEDGAYEVCYPPSVGGELVHRVDPFDAETVLPKEQWMLDLLANTEFPEDRNVLVFSWHTALLPRMQRLLQQRFGFKAPILYPEKVAPSKRQEWITKNVVGKGARVLLANPVCVQTGLNNLVYFSSQVWMENPAVNPFIFRQARGRVDRIGQRAHETRIYFPIYDALGPNKLHSLLLHKVGVAMATDGLDAESALQAAGVGETGAASSFNVGKELYRMMKEQW